MKEGRQRIGANLEARTLAFAVANLRFADTLPPNPASRVILAQLLRSATSIGANYREANRAESKPDFLHKVAIAVKEAAGTEYWLQLCVATPLGSATQAEALQAECDELIAILSTIRHKAAR